MASNGNKLSIQISGETVELTKSLKNINTAINQSKYEARDLQKALKFDPGNVDIVVRQVSALDQAASLSALKVDELKAKLRTIDKDANAKEWVKTAGEIRKAEVETANLQRDLEFANKTLNRMSSSAAKFQFDPGTGMREFQNTVRGVNAALSTLGGVDRLLTFDKAKSSASEFNSHVSDIRNATELLHRKAELLRADLNDIDVVVDPSGFERLQNQLSDVTDQIRRIEEHKVQIHFPSDKTWGERILEGGFNVLKGGLSKISGYITGFFKGLPGMVLSHVKQGLDIGLQGLKAGLNAIGTVALSPINALVATIKNAPSAISGALSAIGSKVSGALQSGLSFAANSAKSIVTGVFSSIGSGIVKTITAPLHGIKNITDTIIRGSLLTVGQNITNAVTGTVKGAIASMGEAQSSAKALENVLSFANVDTSVIQSIKSEMSSYAKETTYGSSELNKVVAGLTSAGVEASKTSRLTKSLGNAYKLLGDGSQKISDIGIIFAQINSATKLTAQDFNQLRNAGLGGAIKQEIEKSFPDIISQFGSFQEAMSKGAISAEMVNQAITNIGESDAAKRAATVPKTIGEAYDTLQETLGQKFQSIYSKLTDSGIGFVQNLTDTIENADFSGLTDILDGMVNKFGDLVTKSVQFITTMDFGPILSVWDNGLGSIKSLLDTVLTVVNNIRSQVDLTSVLSRVVSSFSSLSEIGSIIQASIVNIDFGKVFGSAVSVFENIIGAVRNIGVSLASALNGDTITNGISGLLDIISSIAGYVSKLDLTSVFSATVNVVNALLDTINKIGSVIGSVFTPDVVSKGLTVGLNVITSILNVINQIDFEKVFGAAVPIIENIKTTFAPLFGLISQIFSPENITRGLVVLMNILDGVSSAFAGIAQYVQQAFTSDSVSKLTTDISTLSDNLTNSFSPIMENLKNTFDNIDFGQVIHLVITAVGSLGSAIGDIFSSITKVASGLDLETIFGSFTVFFNTTLKAVGDFAKAIADAFSNKDLGEISSNLQATFVSMSRTLDNLMKSPFFTAFASTIASIITSVSGIISGFISSVTGNIDDLSKDNSLIDNLLNPIKDIFNELERFANSDLFKTGLGLVVAFFQTELEVIVTGFRNLSQVFNDLFANIDLSTITDALKSFADTVLSFFNNAFSGLIDFIKQLKDSGFLDSFAKSITELGTAFGDTMKKLKPFLDLLGKILGYVVGAVFTAAIAAFKALVDVITNLFKVLNDIIDAIGKIGSDIFNWLGEVLGFNGYGYSSAGDTYSSVYSAMDSVQQYNSSNRTTNHVNINVTPSSNMNMTALAREIKHQFELGLA